jgi:two-component system NtrC family sensor kinase
MPGGMGGVELAKAVRQNKAHLPILLITGYSDKASELVKEGFTVLKKPFGTAELSDALRAAAGLRKLTS